MAGAARRLEHLAGLAGERERLGQLAELAEDLRLQVEIEAGGGVPAAEEDSGQDSAAGGTADEVGILAELRAPLTLTSDNFAADVQQELARTAAARRQAVTAGLDGVQVYMAANSGFVCPDGPYGDGATLPAYYDAEEAVLVLRRPQAGIQRVDLLTCGTAEELDSVDLPAP